MLIKKVIDFAKKCNGTIEEIKAEVKEFVGEEEILNEDGEVVEFDNIKFSEKEVKEYAVELEIKEAIKEVKEEVKESNAIETKAVECDTFEVPAYSGRLQSFKTPEDAYSAGQHFLGYAMGNEQAKQWCVDNYQGKTAHNVTTTTQGGYLTSSELDSAILGTLLQYGVARKVITPKIMNELILYVDKHDGPLTAYIVAELAATTESNSTWDQVTVTAKELSVLCLITNLLAANSVINLADHIAVESGRAMALKEDTIIFTGDGSAGNAAVTGLQDTLEADTTACHILQGAGYGWGEIGIKDFTATVQLVPAQYRVNAGWICSRAFKGSTMDPMIYDAGGNNAKDIKNVNADGSFMNFPVYLSEVMPSTQVDDDVSCIFGDVNEACIIGDRQGITMSESNSHNDAFSKRQRYYRVDRMSGYAVHGVRTDGPVAGLVVNSTT